jgi:hypothetical protein
MPYFMVFFAGAGRICLLHALITPLVTKDYKLSTFFTDDALLHLMRPLSD